MSRRPPRVRDRPGDTEVQRLRKALQRVANLPYDAPPERARRIAVGALGGDPSAVPEDRVFMAATSDGGVDYRKVLKAYLNHVGEQEGVTFLGFREVGQDLPDDVRLEGLTPEERKALADVEDEIAAPIIRG